MSFWKKQERPILALAPMADVTDPAYRKLIAETSTVSHITWIEFVSADGLYHTRKKLKDEENPLMRDLLYTKQERPIVAQFFSGNPEMMEYAAALALELGFDGVDINMGCPDKSIEKQGAGAAHIKNPEQAKEIIAGALRGTKGIIPVSVKTRLGYNRIEYEAWLPHLLETGIEALTIHLRTRKEMSKVPAHWERASELVSFCKKKNPNMVLLGNGDLMDIPEVYEKIRVHGFDGAMFGRAIFGNPWLFTNRSLSEVTKKEKVQALLQLARGFNELTPKKHFAILKKHIKAFISGFDGASDLRVCLMKAENFEEFETAVQTELSC